MTNVFDEFALVVAQWSSAIFNFVESLPYDNYLGDTIISLLVELIYSFSVALVFLLPVVVLYLVIKSLVK